MRRFFPLRVLTLLLAGVAPLFTGAAPAYAQGHCIAAMINNLPITAFEASQRVRFSLVLARVPDNAENRERIGRQVLRQMIDERLQLDDAARNGITVDQTEIEQRIQELEQANGMPSGGVRAYLAQSQIPATVLTDQLRASISWSKLVRRKVRAGLEVSDPEIDQALQQLRANAGKSENRVAEIFLPVDRPDQADDVLRTAQRIIQQLRGGAPFPAMVQQFSSGPSAASGGDLGWLLPGSLDPSLDAAIARLGVNQVSDPVRSQSGWHILKLLAQRPYGRTANTNDVRLNMVQLLLPFPANSSPDEIERQKGVAQGIIGQSKSCADLRRICDRTKGCTTADSDGVSTGDLQRSAPAIASAVGNAAIGQAVGPFQAGSAMQIVAVCSREGGGNLPSRDAIQQSIFVSKLEAAARRYMRDLRRNAIIDMRKDCRL